MRHPLRVRRIRFAAEFVANGGNGRAAARAVGYRDPDGAARRLLARDDVQDVIARRSGVEPVGRAGRERRFALAYVEHGANATAAARAAGYAPDSAHVAGCRLLKRPAVRRRIAEVRLAVEDVPDGPHARSLERMQRRAVHGSIAAFDRFVNLMRIGDPYRDRLVRRKIV